MRKTISQVSVCQKLDRNRKPGAVLALGLMVFAAMPSTAFAEAAAPVAAPSNFKLALRYDGRLVVKVLDISLDHSVRDGAVENRTRLRSYGVLSAFKKLDQRASGTARLVDGEARSINFTHQNIDGKRDRKVNVAWRDSDVLTTSNPQYDFMGDPPASLAQKRESNDPLTQLLNVSLSGSSRDICKGTLKIFDGKQRYNLEFTERAPTELSKREKDLGLKTAVQCRVFYKEVAGFKKKPPEKQNQGLNRPIVITFARIGDDGPWVMSDVVAETSLGKARIELKSMTHTIG